MNKLKLIPRQAGFTLMEVLIVIFMIGILATIIGINVKNARDRAYEARAQVEFQTLVNAMKFYAQKYNDYPAEVERGLPPGIEEFVSTGQVNQQWPDGPWPNSLYDYDRWVIDGVDTYQISIRFCPAGATSTSQCSFPKETWAQNFGVNSAYYYCIKGSCRADDAEAITYPGYCVNCPNNQAIQP